MPKICQIYAYYLKESLNLAEITKKNADLPLFNLIQKERNLLLYSIDHHRHVCAFNFGVVVVFGLEDKKEIRKLLKCFDYGTEGETDSSTVSVTAEQPPKTATGSTLPERFVEDYQCLIDPDQPQMSNLETVRIREMTPENIILISHVLAQSVVLDLLDRRVEATMGFFDHVYSELSHTGKMHTGAKKALKAIGTSGSATLFAISRLALLDKPDIAWEDAESQALFVSMRRAFELDDRFAALRLKLDFIRSSSETVLDALHTKRAELLELTIIILIVMEILFAAAGVYH